LNSHGRPTGLYNGMVAPLVPYAIRGAIWYQGESNRGDGLAYEQKMHALINGWRQVWKQGDFPFYYVQLAPYRYRGDSKLLPMIWEAQTNVLKMKNTGMAVTVDVGNVGDIHPRNKQAVGKRLALWALAKDYGRKDLVYSGPLYKSHKVEGGAIRIEFDHAGGGLVSRDDKPLNWATN
jgi:sialate O-acetylesterase